MSDARESASNYPFYQNYSQLNRLSPSRLGSDPPSRTFSSSPNHRTPFLSISPSSASLSAVGSGSRPINVPSRDHSMENTSPGRDVNPNNGSNGSNINNNNSNNNNSNIFLGPSSYSSVHSMPVLSRHDSRSEIKHTSFSPDVNGNNNSSNSNPSSNSNLNAPSTGLGAGGYVRASANKAAGTLARFGKALYVTSAEMVSSSATPVSNTSKAASQLETFHVPPITPIRDDDSHPVLLSYATRNPILSFHPSPEKTRAVLAGKDFLQIVKVSSNEIQHTVDLRSNLSSSVDRLHTVTSVKWGLGAFDHTIAVANSGGTISVYNVDKQLSPNFDNSRNYNCKPVTKLVDYNAYINTMSFDPHSNNILLSGSSNGTIKLWDLRSNNRKPVSIFRKNGDNARQLAYSPFDSNRFAVIYDSGMIQKWDVRHANFMEYRINAHSNRGVTLDWNQDHDYLVSGGKDFQVHVWNMSNPEIKFPDYTIHTPGGVARVRWRPNEHSKNSTNSYSAAENPNSGPAYSKIQAYDIATCSMSMYDNRVSVWSPLKPYIPKYVLNDHANTVSDIYWANSNKLWSAGKDSKLIIHDISNEIMPVTNLTKQAPTWSAGNEISLIIQGSGRNGFNNNKVNAAFSNGYQNGASNASLVGHNLHHGHSHNHSNQDNSIIPQYAINNNAVSLSAPLTPLTNTSANNQSIYNTQTQTHSNPQLDTNFASSVLSGLTSIPVSHHASPEDLNPAHLASMHHNDSNSDNGIIRSGSFRSLHRPSLLGGLGSNGMINNTASASVSASDQYSNMVTNMAALVDDSFSNSSIPQAIHSYTLPDFSSSAFKFCAEQYLIQVPVGFNLFQVCEHNADVAALVGLNRNSQVWRVIATSIKWEHEGFSRDCCVVFPRRAPVINQAQATSLASSPPIMPINGSNNINSKSDSPNIGFSADADGSDPNSIPNLAFSSTGSLPSNITKSLKKLSMKDDLAHEKEEEIRTAVPTQVASKATSGDTIPIKLTDEKGSEKEIIIQSFDSAGILPSSFDSTSSTKGSYEIEPTLSKDSVVVDTHNSQTLEDFNQKANYTSISSNSESNGLFSSTSANSNVLNLQSKDNTFVSSITRLDDIKEENYEYSTTPSEPIGINNVFDTPSGNKVRGETDMVFGSADSYNIGSSYGSLSSIESGKQIHIEPPIFDAAADMDLHLTTTSGENEDANNTNCNGNCNGTEMVTSLSAGVGVVNNSHTVPSSGLKAPGDIKSNIGGTNLASISARSPSLKPTVHAYTSVRVSASESLINNEFKSTDVDMVNFVPTIHNNNVLKVSYTQYAESLNQPWRPINLIKQAVDWSCLQGDAQMCSVLSLLFGEIYPESFHDGENDVVNNIVGNATTTSNQKKNYWSGADMDDSDSNSDSDIDIDSMDRNDRRYYDRFGNYAPGYGEDDKKSKINRKATTSHNNNNNNSGFKGLSSDEAKLYRSEWALFKQQEWIMHYIEILQRRLLFLSSATIIKHVSTRFPETIGSLAQIDTNLNTVCHRCFKPLSENIDKSKANREAEITNDPQDSTQLNKNIDLSDPFDKDVGFWYCLSCKKMLDGCILCREPIKGYAIVNFGCGHRGHASCMSDWVIGQKMSECPSGCGYVLFR